jgi:hypothetical protein
MDHGAMTRSLAAMAAFLALLACTATVRPQKTTIAAPGVTVTLGDGGGGGGAFCPPGQAKKGRC